MLKCVNHDLLILSLGCVCIDLVSRTLTSYKLSSYSDCPCARSSIRVAFVDVQYLASQCQNYLRHAVLSNCLMASKAWTILSADVVVMFRSSRKAPTSTSGKVAVV